MAYQLVAEVLDHSPRDLTLGERAVLLVIAEGARVEHRQWAAGRTELAERAGLSTSGLRAVLRRLRDRGLDVRMPNGRVGADGRPLYAVPGSVVTYRLPAFLPAGDMGAGGQEPSPVDNPDPATPKGGTGNPPAIHKGGTECAQGGHSVAPRGATSAPPPRSRGSVGAPAPVHAPAREAADAGSPPRCPEHCDLPAAVRGPGCRDCAELRRAWAAERTKRNRAEVQKRRQCPACDEFGWLLGPDGTAQSAPAVRCRHTAAARRYADQITTGTSPPTVNVPAQTSAPTSENG